MNRPTVSILSLLSLFALLSLLGRPAFAADLSVTCDGSGNCTKSTATPLFGSSIFWYPGGSLAKTVHVANTSTDTRNMATMAQNVSATGSVDTVLSLSIRQGSTNTVIWAGTLNNFYAAGEIALGTFPPSTAEDYVYTIAMDHASGNGFQEKQTSFDLVLGFTGAAPTPTPTPTPSDSGGVRGLTTGIAPGFAAGILGVTTPLEGTPSANPTETQQVLGTQSPPDALILLSIGIGLTIGAGTVLLYFIFHKKPLQ